MANLFNLVFCKSFGVSDLTRLASLEQQELKRTSKLVPKKVEAFSRSHCNLILAAQFIRYYLTRAFFNFLQFGFVFGVDKARD